MKERNSIGCASNAFIHKCSFGEILIYTYFILTFFEPYLNGVLGSLTKYYVLYVIFYITYKNKYCVRIRSCIRPFVIWLLYRFATLLWTENLTLFRMHAFSQIGMVGLLVALTMLPADKRIITNIAKVMWGSSVIISIMALFSVQAYAGVEMRQVIIMFGQQMDPNDQATFALAGLSIALYYAVFEKKYLLPAYATVFVNIVSMLKTGSRGGLVSMLAIVLFVIVFSARDGGFICALKRVALFASMVVIVFYALRNFIPQNTLNRLFDFSTYEGGSERTLLWANGFKLLKEDLNILFGAGWGDYYGYNGYYKAMHNTYVAMLCDVGIFGFLLFFIPIISKSIWLLKRKEYLPILLLISGLCPSFFLDAINKRFFWNPIMILFMYYTCAMEEIQSEI